MIKIKFNGSNISYDVKFRRLNEHVIHLEGDIPRNTNGFKAYSGDQLLGDYSSFTTIYREFTGGFEFSGNGSVEPTKDIEIKATFNGGESHRPNSVSIVTNKGNDTLSSPTYKKTFTVAESDDVYLVSAQDIEDFTKSVDTLEVTYTYNSISPIPSFEERITDLEEAVCELYERVE